MIAKKLKIHLNPFTHINLFLKQKNKKAMMVIKKLHSAHFIKCSPKLSGHAHRLLDTVCCGAYFSSIATLLTGGLVLNPG